MVVINFDNFVDQYFGRIAFSIATAAIIKLDSMFEWSAATRRENRKLATTFQFARTWISFRLPANTTQQII